MKSIRYQLGNTDLEFDREILNPDVTEEIARALSYLLAYQSVNKRFSLVEVDSQGSLLVNTARPYNSRYVTRDYNLAATATMVCDNDPQRKEILLTVFGPSSIYFADTEDRLASALEIVIPGQKVNIINHTGQLWVLLVGGTGFIRVGQFF